ncbi:MAG: dockerin type I repeat-containing protein, partial [Planctomycetota bacterium]
CALPIFVDGPVTTGLLAEYTDGVVMWPIGYFHSGFPDQLGPVRQALLMEYLQAGGNLVLSGAYATAYLDTTALFTNYLFLQHEQWDMGLPGLLGEPGNPLGDGLDLQLSSGGYQSELTALPPAQKAFSYDPASGAGTLQGGGAAVVMVDEDHKAAVLAFPFSSVVAADRSALMARILEWMLPPSPCADPFIRGDTNGSGAIDISDAVFLLAYLFSAGGPPSPEASGDANADGGIDISDAIYLLSFLFDSGAPPPAPYPDAGCP